ncbi:MAG: hypothetical protein F4149_12470 [Gammaproteobacteria bacterium]|nr:hypothetical protein [Gammaproteobacteria bacterium]MYK83824.1 hypothetical protein [Gammaproteobacteria bacterium]
MSASKRVRQAAPNDVVQRNADDLFNAVALLAPGDHQFEPTEDGGQSMLIESDDGDRVVRIECDSDGGVLCIASIGENLRRAKYYQMDGLPDGFIREALQDVISEREQTTQWNRISMSMKVFGGMFTPADMQELPKESVLMVSFVHSWQTHLESYRSIDWTAQTMEKLQEWLTETRSAGKASPLSTGGLSFQPGRLGSTVDQ